ncbi:hypothetical protein GQ457_03G033780 [Hibiscus cannabinus]
MGRVVILEGPFIKGGVSAHAHDVCHLKRCKVMVFGDGHGTTNALLASIIYIFQLIISFGHCHMETGKMVRKR